MAPPRTKIHCTCGPACRDTDLLAAMVVAGAGVFRVNAALAGAPGISEWAERVRAVAGRLGRDVGVWVDLPGPKYRLGPLVADELPLAVGREVELDARSAPGDGGRLGLLDAPPFAGVPPGSHVVFGDGSGRLEVLRAGSDGLGLRVLEPAVVRPGMGVHFVGAALLTEVPTPRDRDLLSAAVEAGVDAVAQSYVRSSDDVERLRSLLAETPSRGRPSCPLAVAKIERVDAVEALEPILAHADALLVGRGDLGVDAGLERVPDLQRRVLEAGHRAGKPVVVATGFLGSMVRSRRPTRAEVSDVACVVLGGADGVMLTDETARGHDPLLVVKTLADVLRSVEASGGGRHG